MDYLLFLTVAAICAFGVVMLFSASYYYAQSFQGDGYYYVKKQLIFLAIGIPVMFGLSFVDYKFYRRFAWMAYLLIILLLIAVLLFCRADSVGLKSVRCNFSLPNLQSS